MREQGIVVKAEGGVVTVAMAAERHEGCKSCGLCRPSAGDRRMLVDVRDEKPHQVGEVVTIEIPGPGPGWSAVLLMLIPLLLFLAGIGVGARLATGAPLVAMSLGACGLGVGWGIAALVDRCVRRSPKNQPRIVKE